MEVKTDDKNDFAYFGTSGHTEIAYDTWLSIENENENDVHIQLKDNDNNTINFNIELNDNIINDNEWTKIRVMGVKDYWVSDSLNSSDVLYFNFVKTESEGEIGLSFVKELDWDLYNFQNDFSLPFYLGCVYRGGEAYGQFDCFINKFKVIYKGDVTYLNYDFDKPNGEYVNDISSNDNDGRLVRCGWTHYSDDKYCVTTIIDDYLNIDIFKGKDWSKEGELIFFHIFSYVNTIIGNKMSLDVTIYANLDTKTEGVQSKLVFDKEFVNKLTEPSKEFEYETFLELLTILGELENPDKYTILDTFKFDSIGLTNKYIYDNDNLKFIVNCTIKSDLWDIEETFQQIIDYSIKPTDNLNLKFNRPEILFKTEDEYNETKKIDVPYKLTIEIRDTYKFTSDYSDYILFKYSKVMMPEIDDFIIELPQDVVDYHTGEYLNILYTKVRIQPLRDYESYDYFYIIKRYSDTIFDEVQSVKDTYGFTNIQFESNPMLYAELEQTIEQSYFMLPPYLTPSRKTSFIESSGFERDIDFMGNEIDVKIFEMYGDKEVNCKYTSNIAMSMSSEIMKIQNTDFIEHIKNQDKEIQINVVLGDIWKDGEIVRHRDKEKHMLRSMFENQSILSLQSNITSDVSSEQSEKTDKNVNIMNNLMITDISIEQSYDSANTYEATINLKQINVLEPPEYRYKEPMRIGEIREGTISKNEIRIPTERVEEKDEEEEGGIIDWITDTLEKIGGPLTGGF